MSLHSKNHRFHYSIGDLKYGTTSLLFDFRSHRLIERDGLFDRDAAVVIGIDPIKVFLSAEKFATRNLIIGVAIHLLKPNRPLVRGTKIDPVREELRSGVHQRGGATKIDRPLRLKSVLADGLTAGDFEF